MGDLAPPLRRNRAIISKLVDETKTQFLVAHKSLPRDGFKDSHALQIHEVSIPKITGPGPEIEKADKEAEEETNVIYKTVASIPVEDVEMVYSHLLQLNKCYNAMAKNNKIVLFTSDLNVRKAFYALVYNSARTGLVVDASSYKITGVLSATDFIMVLMKLWKFRAAISDMKGEKLSEEEEQRTDISHMPISAWKKHLEKDGRLKKFQTIGVEDSLYAAADRLASSRIHRLPVMDDGTGDCMFIITHRRLLHFIWAHAALLPKPEFLRERVKDLGVGTWSDIKHVVESTSLIDALDILINEGISGVPVVKDEGSLEIVSVYTRFDAISVAFAEGKHDLSISISEAIQQKMLMTGRVDSAVTVPEDISMWSLLETFVQKNVYRVFACTANNRLKGLISLSDLINFMVLRPKTIAI